MARIVVDVDNHKHFKKGDLLIHNGKEFESVSEEYLLRDIPLLYQEIAYLSKQINMLKAQLDYDHGIIDEREYNRLCNGNK